MHDIQENQSQPASRDKPAFRAWLVQNREGRKPLWIELAGLWPNKSGKGHSGKLGQPIATLSGRIVILPADQQKEEG